MFKKLFSRPQPSSSLRDVVFGDCPIEQWPPDDSGEGPFADFVLARQLLRAGDPSAAADLWRLIANTPGIESRHRAQAWTFLRASGQLPPTESAKSILGVVVEVAMREGLDLLAAYPDLTARYMNYSGAGVVWEHPDNSLNQSITLVMREAAALVQRIGPWTEPRPGPPRPGNVRLNMITPSGLHFGEGSMQAIASDPIGGRLFHAATQLMQALIAKKR